MNIRKRFLLLLLTLVSSSSLAQNETATEEDGESGMQNDPAWLATCAFGMRNSGYTPSLEQSYRFKEWMDENTTLDVPRIGFYRGFEEIGEYVRILGSETLDFYNITEFSTVVPLVYSKEECSLLTLTPTRSQLNTKYSTNLVGMCQEALITQIFTYTVDDANGNGFYLKNHYIDWPKKFLQSFFNGVGNGYPKRFCDIFRDSCPFEYQENGLDEESCISKFNSLPEVSEEGFLDENNRGCRFIHSEFANTNNKHCPHISYIPMKDYLNRTKCQYSMNRTEDVLPEAALAARDALRLSLGLDSSLFRPCEYSTTWGEVTVGTPPDYVGEDGDNDGSSAYKYSSIVARLAVPTLLAGFALL